MKWTKLLKRKEALAISAVSLIAFVAVPVFAFLKDPEISRTYVFASGSWQMVFFVALMLAFHFLVPNSFGAVFVFAGLFLADGLLGFLGISYVGRQDVNVSRASLFLLMYASSIFVILSDILLSGGASLLTKMRGEKWVKELDYLYLALGGVGLLGTLNKLDLLGGRFIDGELIGPIILSTAIVIRLIKTRAEIGNWAKLEVDMNAMFVQPRNKRII
jgi:hypothetical protein